MKSSKLGNVIALVMMTAAMSSCEKIVPSESGDLEGGEGYDVALHVSQIETTRFGAPTRSELGDVCNHLCFDIYDEDGQKVKYINQKLDDENFGEASFSLPEGDYYLVVLAHSSAKNPSFATKEMKITASGTLSDMFWTCEPLHISGDNVNKSLTLKRIVSMVRFITDDQLPEEANELLVKYTGSKGTLSALTGYGTTKASQSIILDVDPSDEYYDFYMVPRDDRDTIRNVNVISRYNDGSSAENFSEKTIESIPVRRNCITICRGSLFDGKSSPSGSSSVSIVIDASWNESIEVYF